jgi:hypothetical protein
MPRDAPPQQSFKSGTRSPRSGDPQTGIRGLRRGPAAPTVPFLLVQLTLEFRRALRRLSGPPVALVAATGRSNLLPFWCGKYNSKRWITRLVCR